MKTTTKKNLISLSCSLALIALGSGVALNANSAKAAEDALLTTGASMVVDGAELRLAKEDDATGNGLRFVVKAPEATARPDGTTATGTLVIPTALLNGDLTVGTANVQDFDTTNAWNVYDDGAYTYAYLWNMSEFSYNVEFTYRGYAVIGGETYYTDTATAVIADVALEAIANGSENEKAVAAQYLLNYNVTFDVGESSTTVNMQSVKYGSCLSEVVTPELAGYTFNGWLLDGEAFDVETDVVKGNITLTADWEINTYSVVYKDSANWNNALATETVEHGAKASERAYTLREGYSEFLGWYDADGNKFDFDTPITADIDLYSKAQTMECLDFTTMTDGYRPLFATYKSGNTTKPYTIVAGEGLKFTGAWAGDIKSINYAQAIILQAGDTIKIDVTVKGNLKSGATQLSSAGWGVRFYSVNNFTTAANPAPAEQVAALWDTNESDSVVAGHRETYTLTASKELSIMSFEIRPYSSQEGFDITFHSVHIHRAATSISKTPTDYKNISFGKLGGLASNVSFRQGATGTPATARYCHAEQAYVVPSWRVYNGTFTNGLWVDYPTEGDDAITIVAGMKISLLMKSEYLSEKATKTQPSIGLNDAAITWIYAGGYATLIDDAGVSKGYVWLTFTITESNSQVGQILKNFNVYFGCPQVGQTFSIKEIRVIMP